ncbi:hypothetical protein [Zhongshania marina]|uniref:Uncharacterized protein n=1 Tax=Zhongshania marina TaxID=2304603 RepID=A0ABX9W6U0_9GAMM|nr:hypothetical protein D0911_06375 [Zhongshania marina]
MNEYNEELDMKFCKKIFLTAAIGLLSLPCVVNAQIALEPSLTIIPGFGSHNQIPLEALLVLGEPLTHPENLIDLIGGAAGLGSVIALDPWTALSPLLGFGAATGFTFVPLLEALSNSPAALPDYLVNGGTLIIPDSISVAPAIPLITTPL